MNKERKIRGVAVARVPMSIHFEIGEYAALVTEAARSGCSMQELVRVAVREALNIDDKVEVRK